MKQYALSDDYAALTGMRLAGIKGTYIDSKEAFLKIFHECVKDPDLAVLYISKQLADQYQEEIDAIRFSQDLPLITSLKSAGDLDEVDNQLIQTIQHAIGISI